MIMLKLGTASLLSLNPELKKKFIKNKIVALNHIAETIESIISKPIWFSTRLLHKKSFFDDCQISQVKVALYENGVEKAHVIFNGSGSDYMSWFSQSRLIDSSWIDLTTATNDSFGFVSIVGYVGTSHLLWTLFNYKMCSKAWSFNNPVTWNKPQLISGVSEHNQCGQT